MFRLISPSLIFCLDNRHLVYQRTITEEGKRKVKIVVENIHKESGALKEAGAQEVTLSVAKIREKVTVPLQELLLLIQMVC